MKDIAFNVNDAEIRMAFLSHLLPDAIDCLEADTVPSWGKMTAYHMVEHLVWALQLSTGRDTVTCEIPATRREEMIVWLYDDRPSPRDFKNPTLPDNPLPLRYSSVADAKAAFHKELDHFIKFRETQPDEMNTHPLFGTIATDGWERVHFKHSYHHLLQFGLIRKV